MVLSVAVLLYNFSFLDFDKTISFSFLFSLGLPLLLALLYLKEPLSSCNSAYIPVNMSSSHYFLNHSFFSFLPQSGLIETLRGKGLISSTEIYSGYLNLRGSNDQWTLEGDWAHSIAMATVVPL
jgi:hypothetical protein